MHKLIHRLLSGVLCLSFTTAAPAWAQAHEAKSGSYTLRASTVRSDMLSAEAARRHGIEPSPLRAVLNVTLMKDGSTVAADITALARNLTGHQRPVALTETRANGYVSYTGVYDFVHGEVLDFSIQAQPRGADRQLSLTFRDRMWGTGDLPDGQRSR